LGETTDKENAAARACVTSAIAMAATPNFAGETCSRVVVVWSNQGKRKERRSRFQSMGWRREQMLGIKEEECPWWLIRPASKRQLGQLHQRQRPSRQRRQSRDESRAWREGGKKRSESLAPSTTCGPIRHGRTNSPCFPYPTQRGSRARHDGTLASTRVSGIVCWGHATIGRVRAPAAPGRQGSRCARHGSSLAPLPRGAPWRTRLTRPSVEPVRPAPCRAVSSFKPGLCQPRASQQTTHHEQRAGGVRSSPGCSSSQSLDG
jgi:hypothetical protein